MGTLKIHSENLLPLLKRWLYSDKDIFVRELVANACDAIYKLKILREHSEAPVQEDAPRIDITINREAKTLTFSDNGVGMDAEEVERYICQLAFSGAEEFLKNYQSNQEGDQMIGHFGLGFYSAYMVSSLVEIDSLSLKRARRLFIGPAMGTPNIPWRLAHAPRAEQKLLFTSARMRKNT